MDKARLIRRIDENSLFAYFNSKNAILVVSANPTTFQDLILANKYLLLMSGYTEEDLEDQKLPYILPKGVDVIHDKILYKFMNESKEFNNIIECNYLFMKNKDNTI